MGQCEFSVYQFFDGDLYERVCSFVDAETAVRKAHHYCTSVAARVGLTRRVIITDGLDCTVFEWQFGKGITFGGPSNDTRTPSGSTSGPMPQQQGNSEKAGNN